MLAGGTLETLAYDVAPAKTRTQASKPLSLLALPILRPNWPLALDGQALAAMNLGVTNSGTSTGVRNIAVPVGRGYCYIIKCQESRYPNLHLQLTIQVLAAALRLHRAAP